MTHTLRTRKEWLDAMDDLDVKDLRRLRGKPHDAQDFSELDNWVEAISRGFDEAFSPERKAKDEARYARHTTFARFRPLGKRSTW